MREAELGQLQKSRAEILIKPVLKGFFFLFFFSQLLSWGASIFFYRHMNPLSWELGLNKMNMNRQGSLEKSQCVALLDAIIIFKCPERNMDV